MISNNFGSIKSVCNYINDKKNGCCITYYSDGQIARICNYVDDKLNGEFKDIIFKKNSGVSNNWVKLILENNYELILTDNHWIWSETKKEYIQINNKDLINDYLSIINSKKLSFYEQDVDW